MTRDKPDYSWYSWTVKLVNIESLPYAVTKRRSCHFGSLSMRPAVDGDLLACKDMGRESDSMLSLTLIFRNFHWRHGRIYRGNCLQLSGCI